MSVLVTGTRSGLGHYLAENFHAICISRQQPLAEVASSLSGTLDAIIHCAANEARDVTNRDLPSYLEDNLFLTEQLTQIPHRIFILISTIGVYPPTDTLHREDDELWIGNLHGAYNITKLMSEAVVRQRCPRYLILRPTAMLGIYSRPNSLVHILTEDNCRLTLSGDSAFNYILHRDVAEFIRLCMHRNILGIFNLASDDKIRLAEVMQRYKRQVQFGSHHYQIGTIDNNRAKQLLPAFGRRSEAVIEDFLREFTKSKQAAV